MNDSATPLNWYAIKVYFNRVESVVALLRAEGLELYDPSKEIPSLLFVRCTQEVAERIGATQWQRLWIYRQPGQRSLAAIPEHEMQVFRFVVSGGHDGLIYLGDDLPRYHQGDRVRVMDGPFRGTEGHVCRVKKDRRVVVSIRGVVAVATTFIHPSMLQKVEGGSTNTQL